MVAEKGDWAGLDGEYTIIAKPLQCSVLAWFGSQVSLGRRTVVLSPSCRSSCRRVWGLPPRRSHRSPLLWFAPFGSALRRAAGGFAEVRHGRFQV